MHNGVSLDVAMSLSDIDRAGWSIIFSEFQGNKFDVDRMEFVNNDA